MENKTTQQNIPEGWKLVKLKEISKKIGSGVTPRGGSEVYTKKGIIFLRSQNIQNGYLSLADVEYITDEINNRMSNSKVEKNDILYNITGASIGRSTLYTLNDKANVNQHVCIIRLKNENPRFVNYFLRSSLGGKQLDSFQAGGNRQGLNYNQLGSFKFLLPPHPEQNCIVSILETWDQSIEKLKRKIEVKKEIKKGLMQELLTGKTRLSGFKDEWVFKSLGEVCKRVSRRNAVNNQNVLTISAQKGLINQRRFFDKRIAANNLENYWLLTKGDFAYNKSYSNGYPMGAIKRLNQYDSGVVSSLYIIFVPHGIDSDYLEHYFDLGLYNKEISMVAQEGARNHGLLNIGIEDFFAGDLYIPTSIEEQKAIANILFTTNSQINKLENKLSILKDQKKYLLNNLVTGAIRTPESLSIFK